MKYAKNTWRALIVIRLSIRFLIAFFSGNISLKILKYIIRYDEWWINRSPGNFNFELFISGSTDHTQDLASPQDQFKVKVTR